MVLTKKQFKNKTSYFRKKYRKNLLPASTIEKLEDLPNWSWDAAAKHLSYEKAKECLKPLKITSWQDFNKRRPAGVPSRPKKIYCNNWENYQEFFNLPRKKSFLEVRKIARGLKCSGKIDYGKRRVAGMPGCPERVYKKEWNGWSDFLGTEPKRDLVCIARELFCKHGVIPDPGQLKKMNLISLYYAYRTNPRAFRGIPLPLLKPQVIKFTYKQAQKYVRKHKIKTVKNLHKIDPRLPAQPHVHYRTEWKGYVKFLNLPKRPSFTAARRIVRKLRFSDTNDFFKNRPKHIPCNPQVIYASEWVSWFDFLGKPTVKRHKPSEWVRIAEKLAKVNGGVLPGSLWLNTHGYSGLASLSGRDHPELFKHISRSSKRLRNYPWKDLS